MTESLHPAASPHLPPFITAPGQTDILLVVVSGILALSVVGFGVLFLRLHSLPERIAHKSEKLQFEIVAVLCLIALFTHMHIFWIAGLLLALIEMPDFGTPLNRIAGSTEKLAGFKPGEGAVEIPREAMASGHNTEEAGEMPPRPNTEINQTDGTVVLPASPEIAPARHREAAHA